MVTAKARNLPELRKWNTSSCSWWPEWGMAAWWQEFSSGRRGM